MPEIGDFNSMQANVGLVYEPREPTPLRILTPGEASIRVTEQATRNLVEAQQQRTAPATVGQQFRQQFQAIQAQQSLNPYAAQAMARAMPGATGYDAGMLPSPITMTPPSTGVFRPQFPTPTMPIPPMLPPPVNIPPFTAMPPAPMFQTPYEQQARLADARATENYAYMSQAPNFAGQAAGYMGGAYLGARTGARMFGARGALVGAVGGTILAGASGMAQTLGNIGDFAMRPSLQRHQMGGAIQNFSRDWVVGGSDIHALGRGLSRNASIRLAGGIQDMAADTDFQRQTGDMFNQADLMKMMKGAGQAGLMDMQQSVPQIEQQLRQVATTVSKFMQLTNDPDVTNVIRKMGQLQQFGLNPQEMEQAAYNMKRFSRAAGTSIEGLQQMGGLPGAMTFQQAGMTAGAGFRYGNYAAAAARQAVASGDISTRQLALMGGIQGMTQRDIQAQAAFSSMPLFTGSVAQYGPQGWGVNAGMAQGVGGGGALGMVRGAVANMNQAVQQGGIGALVTYGTQQRELREQAMAELTPAEMMAQRFKLAMQTGQQVGLRGEAALSGGAQLAFGREVAEQMMVQAKSPGFWDAQRDLIRRQKRELAMTQYQQIEEAGSGWTMRQIKGAYRGSWLQRGVGTVEDFGSAVASPFRSAGRAVSGAAGDVSDWWEDLTGTPEGVVRTRVDEDIAAAGAGLQASRGRLGYISRGGGNVGEDFTDVDNLELQRAMSLQDRGFTSTMATVGKVSAYGGAVAATAGAGLGLTGLTKAVGADLAAGVVADAIPWAQGAAYDATMRAEDKGAAIRKLRMTDRQTLALTKGAAARGGATAAVDKVTGVLNTISKKNDSLTTGYGMLKKGGRIAQRRIEDAASRGSGMTTEEWREVIVETMRESGVKDPEGTVANMSDSTIQGMKEQMLYQANQDPDTAKAWQGVNQKSLKAVEERVNSQLARSTKHLDANIADLEDQVDFEFDESMTKFATWIGKEAGASEFGFASLIAAGGAESSDPNVRKQYARYTKHLLDTGKMTREELGKKEQAVEAKLKSGGAYAEKMKEFGVSMDDFRDVMEGGLWDAGGSMGRVTAIVQGKTEKGIQKAFRSKGFRETISPFIGDEAAEELFGGGGMISARAIAAKVTPEAMKKMGKKRAALYKRAQEGDEDALRQIQQEAISADTSGEVTETVAREATGEQAKKLDREERAMSDMQNMFSDFSPAAKEFRQGARMLRQAMESEMMKKMRR